MEGIISALKDTPIPTILVITGIGFLLLSIVGRLAGRIALRSKGQWRGAVLGCALITLGFALHVAPHVFIPTDSSDELMPDSPKPPLSYGGLADIDRILETLPLANIAFNAPLGLRVNDSARIQLLLSTQHSIEQLQSMIAALGEREGARTRISNHMEARLSGLGFKIETITPEIQAVSEQNITEWRWEIEATRSGTQRLYLTLSALLYVANDRIPRAIRTFERTIEVQVTWPQSIAGFAKGNWQWLWTAILIPIVGWIIRKRKKQDIID